MCTGRPFSEEHKRIAGKKKQRKIPELPHCLVPHRKIPCLFSSPVAGDLCSAASRPKQEFGDPPVGLELWTSWLSAASPQSTSGSSSVWICTQKVKGWSHSSAAELLTRSSQNCLLELTTLDTKEENDSWELKVLSREEREQDASLDRVKVKEDFCWSCFPETMREREGKEKLFPSYSGS